VADQTPKDEKTEEATARRMEESREKGQVAFSSEIMAATTLVSAVLAVLFMGGTLANSSALLLENGILEAGQMATMELDLDGVVTFMKTLSEHIVPSFLMFLAPMVLVTWIAAYAQIGLRFAPKAVTFDPGKLSPMKGFQRMFSMRSVVRTGLATLKILLVMGAIVSASYFQLEDMSPMAGNDLRPTVIGMGVIALKSALAGIAVVIVLAVTDLLYQQHQNRTDMRMSKKEVRDEYKNTEGDPQVKARIRRVQREMSNRRMMNDVPEATVVVTNPTHFSVALKYDEGSGKAPIVVAKGVDSVAFRIREVAKEAGVMIHPDPPLARALHREVEIGEEVPEDLFQAVAGVLAYVFKVQGRKAATSGA
tara:strand:+ start:17816 stop:18910 length:1095 start_codon:yes stop_codon:yes gene_type:complete